MTATAGSTTSLDVSWTAPKNTGRPAVTSYDFQYKKTIDDTWTDGPQNVTTTSASISGLVAEISYDVQVRATNDEGAGAWSQSGTGTTNAPPNIAPTFTNGNNTSRNLAETVGDATVGTAGNIGAPIIATDDDNDTLTYTLDGANTARS